MLMFIFSRFKVNVCFFRQCKLFNVLSLEFKFDIDMNLVVNIIIFYS